MVDQTRKRRKGGARTKQTPKHRRKQPAHIRAMRRVRPAPAITFANVLEHVREIQPEKNRAHSMALGMSIQQARRDQAKFMQLLGLNFKKPPTDTQTVLGSIALNAMDEFHRSLQTAQSAYEKASALTNGKNVGNAKKLLNNASRAFTQAQKEAVLENFEEAMAKATKAAEDSTHESLKAMEKFESSMFIQSGK